MSTNRASVWLLHPSPARSVAAARSLPPGAFPNSRRLVQAKPSSKPPPRQLHTNTDTMTAADTALAVINVVATMVSVGLYLSPLADFVGIYRRKATGEVAILPVVVLFANSVMWTAYGALDGSIFPVCVVNAFGVVTTVSFSLVFYTFATRPRLGVLKLFSMAVLLLCVPILYIILSKAGAIHQSSDTVVKVMGYASVAINICMYASPLGTMRKVVRTKSVASLPIWMSVVSLSNGALWTAYAILEGDMFILVPNATGVLLTTAQVVLYLMYRNATPVDVDATPGLPVIVDDSVAQLKGSFTHPAGSAVVSPLVLDTIEVVTPTTAYEVLHGSNQ
jgi:solute carrier family 50 protein (sugar transporter)